MTQMQVVTHFNLYTLCWVYELTSDHVSHLGNFAAVGFLKVGHKTKRSFTVFVEACFNMALNASMMFTVCFQTDSGHLLL